jgi:hypothetical protein
MNKIKKTHLLILIVAITGLIVAGIWESQRFSKLPPAAQENENPAATTTAENGQNATSSITTFEECVSAGKEVVGEKPNRHCIVRDDLVYIEIETCAAPDGKTMSLFEALNLFSNGKCGWEGSAKDEHFCNETAGAWEIGILAYRKNCIAVCVIDIAAKESRVDWRCNPEL